MSPSVDNDILGDFVCHVFSFIQKFKKSQCAGKNQCAGYFFKWPYGKISHQGYHLLP